jgi:hypothetical protein
MKFWMPDAEVSKGVSSLWLGSSRPNRLRMTVWRIPRAWNYAFVANPLRHERGFWGRLRQFFYLCR